MPIPIWALAVGGLAAAGAAVAVLMRDSGASIVGEDPAELLRGLGADDIELHDGGAAGVLAAGELRIPVTARTFGRWFDLEVTLPRDARFPAGFSCDLHRKTLGWSGRVQLDELDAKLESDALLWLFFDQKPDLFAFVRVDRVTISDELTLLLRTTHTMDDAGAHVPDSARAWITKFRILGWTAEEPGDFWFKLSQTPPVTKGEARAFAAHARSLLGDAYDARVRALRIETSLPDGVIALAEDEGPGVFAEIDAARMFRVCLSGTPEEREYWARRLVDLGIPTGLVLDGEGSPAASSVLVKEVLSRRPAAETAPLLRKHLHNDAAEDFIYAVWMLGHIDATTALGLLIEAARALSTAPDLEYFDDDDMDFAIVPIPGGYTVNHTPKRWSAVLEQTERLVDGGVAWKPDVEQIVLRSLILEDTSCNRRAFDLLARHGSASTIPAIEAALSSNASLDRTRAVETMQTIDPSYDPMPEVGSVSLAPESDEGSLSMSDE